MSASEPLATPEPARPSRRFRRKKPLLVAAVVIASLLAGSVAVGARSNDDAGYRTAVAGTHEVDQVLDSVGTVEPVSQASVAFPVDGTVSTVDVEVGDTVAVGQQLASLDVEDLTTSLHEEQAALTQAQLTLSLALAGEDVSSSAAGGTPSSGALGRSAGSGTSSALAAAQQAVLDAQQAVDAAMADAQAALDNATSVCAVTDTSSTTTTSADADATTDATTDDTTDAAAPADVTACQSALAATLAAQQQVTTAQAQLNDAADALTTLIEDLADDAASSTTTTTAATTGSSGTGSGSADSSTGSSGAGGSSATPSGSSSSSGTPSTGSGTGTSSSPSAEDLIAYQKAVDAAQVEVDVSEQAVAQATIVSPIAGTVVSVGLEVGDDATAASATQTIVVVGDGGVEVTTSVSVSDLPDVEVGQAASVTPDGSSDELSGEVVRIAAVADSSSSYAVTISLTGDTTDLGNGSTAAVAIVTDAAGKALAVPTSAVTVDGSQTTVQTIVDGKAKTTEVGIGAVGERYTEITSGLSSGAEVVLADLSEPLPSAATSSSNGSSSGSSGGSFPGGGMGAPPGMGGN